MVRHLELEGIGLIEVPVLMAKARLRSLFKGLELSNSLQLIVTRTWLCKHSSSSLVGSLVATKGINQWISLWTWEIDNLNVNHPRDKALGHLQESLLTNQILDCISTTNISNQNSQRQQQPQHQTKLIWGEEAQMKQHHLTLSLDSLRTWNWGRRASKIFSLRTRCTIITKIRQINS